MAGGTHNAPLSSWERPVVVATVLAYRSALGGRGGAAVAFHAARAAFVAAGGGPERAAADVPLIVAAAARDHPDWLYRPARARSAREEACWKGRGVWPPPKDRSRWPKEMPA